MKKFVLILLIVSFAVSNFAFASSEDGMTTFENLCALEDEFVIRLREVGSTDEQIKAFLDDMDAVVDSFQANIYMADIDEYFITIFLQTMQKEEHIPVLIAFDMAYQEEIAYMLQYRKVPRSMTTFKMVVFSEKLQFESVENEKNNVIDIPEPEVDEIIENPPRVEITLPFSDISNHVWAVDSIVYLYNNKVVNGTEENIFEPDKPVTREEFLKMIVEALLKTDETFNKEFGVSGYGKWYYSYLAAAKFYALTQGIYDEDNFEEEVCITRQDMTAIAYRAALRADIELPNKKYSTDFLDMNTCSYYSIQAIKELQEADIIHGTGNNKFEPYSTTTRAEAAKIIHSLMLLR